MDDEILLGAMGQMYSVQIPENGGFSAHLVKFGSVQRGISGAGTADQHGARYEFTMNWEDLNEDQCSELLTLYSQVRSSLKPVRLILPHRRNMLTASASSGRSVARHRESTIHYQALGGFVTVSTPEVQRPDQDALYPLSPRLTRYVHLVNGGGSNDYVYPESIPDVTTGTPWSRIPVVPGRQYTLSALYRLTTAGSQTSRLRHHWRRDDGDNTGAPAVTTVDLLSTTWTWASITVTVPTDWPGFAPAIEVGSDAVVDIAAMQFEPGSVRTPWVMGSGVPVVSMTDLQFTDTLWPLRNATLTMTEL